MKSFKITFWYPDSSRRLLPQLVANLWSFEWPDQLSLIILEGLMALVTVLKFAISFIKEKEDAAEMFLVSSALASHPLGWKPFLIFSIKFSKGPGCICDSTFFTSVFYWYVTWTFNSRDFEWYPICQIGFFFFWSQCWVSLRSRLQQSLPKYKIFSHFIGLAYHHKPLPFHS